MHPFSRFKVIGVCALLVLFSACLTAFAAPKTIHTASATSHEPAKAAISSPGSALSCGPWQFVSSLGLGSLGGVAAVSAHEIWAVGSNAAHTLTEHWNGTLWSVVRSPNGPLGAGTLNAVTAISANDVWTVGT